MDGWERVFWASGVTVTAVISASMANVIHSMRVIFLFSMPSSIETDYEEVLTIGADFLQVFFILQKGRAIVGMLAVFAEFERDVLKERVKAGIAQTRKDGKPHGRPPTIAHQKSRIRELHAQGVSKA